MEPSCKRQSKTPLHAHVAPALYEPSVAQPLVVADGHVAEHALAGLSPLTMGQGEAVSASAGQIGRMRRLIEANRPLWAVIVSSAARGAASSAQ